MRPSEIMSMGLGILISLAMIAWGVGALVDRTGGKYWFFWIAPVLTIAAGAGAGAWVVGYYLKVGRPATKGRPRSD